MMKINNKFALVLVLALFLIGEFGLCIASSSAGKDDGFITMETSDLLGGLREYRGNENDGEIESIGRYAVQEHNKKENSLLEFAKVIKAKEQVVAGMMYHLTLEAIDSGEKKIYEAKVWVKPWMNFKQLQEFRHTADVASSTSSDPVVEEEREHQPGPSCESDGHEPGWRMVPTHDTSVLDAAHYAVETIQHRSNCLGACFLSEIILAKAKVIENDIKFYLLMKTKWNTREEIYKVMLSKNINGKFYGFKFL